MQYLADDLMNFVNGSAEVDGVAAFADVTFEVDFGGADFGEYEIIEEGRPDDAYKEWLIPAQIANGMPRRLLEDEERY